MGGCCHALPPTKIPALLRPCLVMTPILSSLFWGQKSQCLTSDKQIKRAAVETKTLRLLHHSPRQHPNKEEAKSQELLLTSVQKIS